MNALEIIGTDLNGEEVREVVAFDPDAPAFDPRVDGTLISGIAAPKQQNALDSGTDALVLHGHVIDALRTLPEKSVHCLVTSPPYWGLRKYAGGKQLLWGGDPECEHEWSTGPKSAQRHRSGAKGGLHEGRETNGLAEIVMLNPETGDTCGVCGAFRGELGLEPTFQQYVANIVAIFREVRRVLRDDGIVALNIGDSYGNDSKWGGSTGGKHVEGLRGETGIGRTRTTSGVPPKSKLLIPHRTAIVLAEDGWVVRQDCVWSKRSPMPESVQDRPTTSHEYMFLLAKRPQYYWDAEAVKVKAATADRPNPKPEDKTKTPNDTPFMGNDYAPGPSGYGCGDDGKANMRSVIHIASDPFDSSSVGAGDVQHFAAFPRALITPFILAGCPETCCAKCGAGYVRMTSESREVVSTSPRYAGCVTGDGSPRNSDMPRTEKTITTLGWQPSCQCGVTETVPGVVMDTFLGSGTSGEVALNLGRKFIGCEVSAEYVKLASKRLRRRGIGLFSEGDVKVVEVPG